MPLRTYGARLREICPSAWPAHVKSQQQRIERIRLCPFVSYNAAYVPRPMRL